MVELLPVAPLPVQDNTSRVNVILSAASGLGQARSELPSAMDSPLGNYRVDHKILTDRPIEQPSQMNSGCQCSAHGCLSTAAFSVQCCKSG